VIVTWSWEGGQVPLVIDQRNVFGPTPRFVTVEVGEFGETIVPDPDVSVHVPVPLTGVFPASVAVVEHTV
jgi:hypothetical protein